MTATLTYHAATSRHGRIIHATMTDDLVNKALCGSAVRVKGKEPFQPHEARTCGYCSDAARNIYPEPTAMELFIENSCERTVEVQRARKGAWPFVQGGTNQ